MDIYTFSFKENAQLRERLFGKSNDMMMKLPNKLKKNAAFLFVVIFMVSINVGTMG